MCLHAGKSYRCTCCSLSFASGSWGSGRLCMRRQDDAACACDTHTGERRGQEGKVPKAFPEPFTAEQIPKLPVKSYGPTWFPACFCFFCLFCNPPESRGTTGEGLFPGRQNNSAHVPGFHIRRHNGSGAWWSIVSLQGPELTSATPSKVKGVSERRSKVWLHR